MWGAPIREHSVSGNPEDIPFACLGPPSHPVRHKCVLSGSHSWRAAPQEWRVASQRGVQQGPRAKLQPALGGFGSGTRPQRARLHPGAHEHLAGQLTSKMKGRRALLVWALTAAHLAAVVAAAPAAAAVPGYPAGERSIMHEALSCCALPCCVRALTYHDGLRPPR